MNRLWAPWRKAYIRPSQKRRVGCIFCAAVRQQKDKINLIVCRSRHSFVILNKFPYNNGHLMIVPNRHVSSLSLLSAEEKVDVLDLMDKMLAVIRRAMKAQGFNIGINMGRIAGAGIPGHVHIHIVPRWKGDVNFMPVLGDAKVISESLYSAYETFAAELLKGNKRKITAKRK